MGRLGRCNGAVGCRFGLTLLICINMPCAESGLSAEDRAMNVSTDHNLRGFGLGFIHQVTDQDDDSHGDEEPYRWTEATIVRVFLFKVGGVQ